MGYALLKRQHRSRTAAILPSAWDFTNHYVSHYKLGDESPLDFQSCDLPDDVFEKFDEPMQQKSLLISC